MFADPSSLLLKKHGHGCVQKVRCVLQSNGSAAVMERLSRHFAIFEEDRLKPGLRTGLRTAGLRTDGRCKTYAVLIHVNGEDDP